MSGEPEGARGFTFRRASDGVTYWFQADGAGRWKRTDMDLWCSQRADGAWVIVDSLGSELGWPVVAPEETHLPPAGTWRSAKAGKSYLYRLEWE